MTFGLSDAIAILALLVAAYAAWKTVKFNERQEAFIQSQEALNQRLLHREDSEVREAMQADIGAAFVKLGSNSYRLKIFNKGKCAARDVRISFPEGNDCLIESDIQSKFPMELLDRHQTIELIASPHFGSKSKHPITLRWSDDLNTHNEKTLYPTL